MTSLEALQTRRASIVMQRDQFMANANAAVGAIALCDDLIAEAQAAEAKKDEAVLTPPKSKIKG